MKLRTTNTPKPNAQPSVPKKTGNAPGMKGGGMAKSGKKC